MGLLSEGVPSLGERHVQAALCLADLLDDARVDCLLGKHGEAVLDSLGLATVTALPHDLARPLADGLPHGAGRTLLGDDQNLPLAAAGAEVSLHVRGDGFGCLCGNGIHGQSLSTGGLYRLSLLPIY